MPLDSSKVAQRDAIRDMIKQEVGDKFTKVFLANLASALQLSDADGKSVVESVPSDPDGMIDVDRFCKWCFREREKLRGIVAGGYASAALCDKLDSQPFLWGDVPEGSIPELEDYKLLAFGFSHGVVVSCRNMIRTWGSGPGNQTPPTLDSRLQITMLAAGQEHTLALTSDGKILAWGGDRFMQCKKTPTGESGFKAIAAGGYHSMAIDKEDKVRVWGWDACGQCSLPQPGLKCKKIAAGYDFSLAVTINGGVEGWGDDGHNQVSGATQAIGSNKITEIAAGMHHAVALSEKGQLFCWGSSTLGQLKGMPSGSCFKAIAAGAMHSVAINDKDRVFCWGANTHGQRSGP